MHNKRVPAPQTKLQKLLALWPVLVALIGGVSGTYTWIKTQHVLRMDAGIEDHDRELTKAAHPTLQVRLKAIENHWTDHALDSAKIAARITKLEDDLKELYWYEVGIRAAELEPNRQLRALAAREARDRFRRYVREGETLRAAYRHTLETPPPR